MKRIQLLLLILLVGILAACGDTNSDGEIDTIVFADGEWDSVMVHNGIAQKIIEEGYGYETEAIKGSTAATFQGLRKGEINVYMEVWTDLVKEIYEEGIEDGVYVDVGVNFSDNEQGFYVPRYVIEGDSERGIEPLAPDLKTVEDLKKYPEVFPDPEDPSKGIFYNGPSSWSVSGIVDEKFDAYNLGETFNNFAAGSQVAMNAALESAYRSGEGWVGYTWSPTATTAKYDLVLLDEAEYDEAEWLETKKTKFPVEDVLITVHADFVDQAPDIIDFLGNYETTSDSTEAGVDYMIENNATAEEAAIWWLNEFEDIWTEWVTDDVEEKVQTSLN